jgi:hypothetical protein
MARETAAQRNARFDTEREARLSREVAEYPQRLMNVLTRATKQSFNLTLYDNKFQVTTSYDYRAAWTLAYNHSPNSWDQLQELEWKLDDLDRVQAEEMRLAAVKAEALRKVNDLLTAEELQLLNL